MKSVAFAAVLLLGAAGEVEAADGHVVAMLSLQGEAPEEERTLATIKLEEMLTALPEVEVRALQRMAAVFGEDRQARVDACSTLACLAGATESVPFDVLVRGTLVDRGDRLVLSLETADRTKTGTITQLTARRSSNETFERGERAIEAAIERAVVQLFPIRAKRAFGVLVLVGDVEGAAIEVDGQRRGSFTASPTDPLLKQSLDLPAGVRRIRVTAPGHFPYESEAEVRFGRVETLTVNLRKNRSLGPIVLGGAGAAALIGGTVAAVTARATVSKWENGCPANMSCELGLTRDAYDFDDTTVSARNFLANGLLFAGAGAVLGAGIWYLLDPGVDVEEDASR